MTVTEKQLKDMKDHQVAPHFQHPPLTVDNQKKITARNRKEVQSLIKQVNEYTADPDKRERRVQEVCRACYYLGSPRFPKLTPVMYHCAICNDEVNGTLRDVPMLCEECAQRTELCMLCGGDQELRTARRKWDTTNEAPAEEATGVEHSPDQTVSSHAIGGSLETKLSEAHGHDGPGGSEVIDTRDLAAGVATG